MVINALIAKKGLKITYTKEKSKSIKANIFALLDLYSRIAASSKQLYQQLSYNLLRSLFLIFFKN